MKLPKLLKLLDNPVAVVTLRKRDKEDSKKVLEELDLASNFVLAAVA